MWGGVGPVGVGPVEGAAGSRGWGVAPPPAPVEVSWMWEDPCVVGRVRAVATSRRGLVDRVRAGRQSGRARVPLVRCPAGRPRFDGAGWLRRFAAHAEAVRVWFTVLAHDMDPLLGRIFPTGSLFGDAVEAVGMAARAAEKRLGPQHGWGFVSRASAGALLANTGCPWAATL